MLKNVQGTLFIFFFPPQFSLKGKSLLSHLLSAEGTRVCSPDVLVRSAFPGGTGVWGHCSSH